MRIEIGNVTSTISLTGCLKSGESATALGRSRNCANFSGEGLGINPDRRPSIKERSSLGQSFLLRENVKPCIKPAGNESAGLLFIRDKVKED